MENVVGIGLGEAPGWIHLVNQKGDAPCAKFLDKQVAEEVGVPREVRHVHDLCEPPRGGGRGIVSAPVFGHLDCPRGRRGLAS